MPPTGAVTFAAEWGSQALTVQTQEIDAEIIRAASAGAEELWERN